MASIIISDETTRDVPEVSKMLDDRLKGKITMSCFLKFLNDNNIGIKVRYKNKDVNSPVNSSVLNHFINCMMLSQTRRIITMSAIIKKSVF